MHSTESSRPIQDWRSLVHGGAPPTALLARDYPVRGLWQIIPGPGFVRLYHVKAAFSDLDSAVEAAPWDPVVRLIRASTYLAMPSVFGGGDKGRADFDELRAWTSDPDGNPEFSDLLQSQSWRAQYFFARARAMDEVGEHEDAARAWEQLSEATDDRTLQELATWHRISLDASR